MKFLEIGFLRVVAHLVSSDEIRSSVIEQDGLGMMLRSFIRVRLRRGLPVQDSSGSPGNQEHNDHLLKELIGAVVSSVIRYGARQFD